MAGKQSRAMRSGAVLREARIRAGLSQAELAARAGVAQSMISMYESGRRQPALPTLLTLIDATGHDLDMRLRQRRMDRLTGPLGIRLRQKRREVLRITNAADIRVRGVFGSVARGEDRSDSDVDLLVDLPQDIGLFGLAQVQGQLEQVVGARVELIPETDLKPGVRAAALTDLVPL